MKPAGTGRLPPWLGVILLLFYSVCFFAGTQPPFPTDCLLDRSRGASSLEDALRASQPPSSGPGWDLLLPALNPVLHQPGTSGLFFTPPVSGLAPSVRRAEPGGSHACFPMDVLLV